jgi:glycosyltransferase involved in cell wall biosynthesis
MTKRPRVFVLSFNSVPEAGGAEKQFFIVARGIQRAGGRALVVGARLPGLAARELRDTTPVRRLPLLGWHRWLKQAVTFPAYVLLLAGWLVLKRHDYDCVMVGAFDISVVAAGLACAVLRRPYVIRYASLADLEILQRTWVGALGRRYLWRARGYVVNSPIARRRLEELRIPVEKINLIPNACAPHQPRLPRDEVRKELGVGERSVVFINVSSFHPGKGQEALVAAWPLIRSVQPGRLLLVGDGSRLEACKQLLRPELREEVIFLGRRSDVSDLLEAADVFLFPSDYPEGASNALMEAMAAGLPCIFNNVEQNRQLIEDGVEGIGYEASAESLVLAITKWQMLPDRGRALGLRARKRIIRDNSVENCVALHLAAITQAGST